MARVLIPHMARRYNHNPKGSATAQVTMAGDNPFERQVNVVNARRSMLPGMGALGMTDGPSTPADAAAPASTGVDWSKLLTGVVAAGTQLATVKLQQAANPKLPKATGIAPIPVAGPYGAMAPASSKAPWIIGGIAVLALGAFFVLRK